MLDNRSPSPQCAGRRIPARTTSTSVATPPSARCNKHGMGMVSKTFRSTGHWWKLTYYPNGYADSRTGCPGMMLSLMENGKARLADATAAHSMSVLDRNGNLLYLFDAWSQKVIASMTPRAVCRTSGSTSWMPPWPRRPKEMLRRLKDDFLVVWCDLTVQRSEKEVRQIDQGYAHRCRTALLSFCFIRSNPSYCM